MAIRIRKEIENLVKLYKEGLLKEGYSIKSEDDNSTTFTAYASQESIDVIVTVNDLPDRFQLISRTETSDSHYHIKTHRLTAYYVRGDIYADSPYEAETLKKSFTL